MRNSDAPTQWVWIHNWRSFQHYKDRNPPWIKNYTDLLHRDEYLNLTTHRRGLLHGIWLAFAMSSGRLRFDSRTLSARLCTKVTTSDLQSLNHAGFICPVASGTLEDCLQNAIDPASEALCLARADAPSQEAEAETEAQDQEEPIQNQSVRSDSELRPPASESEPDDPDPDLDLDFTLNGPIHPDIQTRLGWLTDHEPLKEITP